MTRFLDRLSVQLPSLIYDLCAYLTSVQLQRVVILQTFILRLLRDVIESYTRHAQADCYLPISMLGTHFSCSNFVSINVYNPAVTLCQLMCYN